MRVSFQRAARREALDAKYWFVDRDPASPETFQRALDAAVATLEQFPDAGASYVFGARRLLLERVPYYLVYRVAGSSIRVLAVAHAKQQPGYWRDRR